MKRVIILIILGSFFSSCYSKLKVVVKTADRDMVMANAGELIRADAVSSVTAIEKFIANSAKDRDTILKRVIKYRNSNNLNPLNKQTENLFKTKYDDRISEIDRDNKAALKELDFTDAKTRQDSTEKYTKAYVYIDNAQLKITKLVNYITENNVDEQKLKAQQLLLSNTTLAKTVQEIANARMRFPILGDPLTSYITKNKNKEIWKSLFNETLSWTLFGNSDIAMILRSNPPEREIRSGDYNNNFTIKGVRLDASDATNAFFTGLTQTMNFIASTQGIPLPQSQKGTTDNPIPATSSLIDGMVTDQNTYAAKRKKLEDVKKMLLEKIKVENIGNKKGTAAITASAKRIEEYWNELKKQLQ